MECDFALIEEKRRISISYIERILSGDEGIPIYSTFSNNCEGLLEFADVSGLSEGDLCKITEILTNFMLDFRHFSFLLGCLVSELTMPKEVVKKMQNWLLRNFWKDSEVSKCNVVLQWFASGLQYEVINKKFMQDQFLFLFHVLKKYPLSKAASSVICLVAETDFFSKNHVNIIIDLQDKATKVKTPPMYFSHLLRFIKTFRPELVPFQVPRTAGMTALIAGNRFNSVMEVVTKRISGESTMEFTEFSTSRRCEEELVHDLSAMNESDHLNFNQRQKRKTKENLNLPMEGHFARSVQSDKLVNINITDVSSYTDLGRNWNNIVIPDNSISLLNHRYGLFLLAFGSEQLKERFTHNLHQALQTKVLLEQYSRQDEIAILLKLVVRFETFLQQGLSPVSQFLRCYLPFWNGLEYRPLIFKLISWITFDTYEELNQFCLAPLFYLFTTTPTEVKCEIIQCLTNLFSNMILFTLERFKKNEACIFLPEASAQDWVSDPHSVILNVVEFVEQLVIIGLLQEPGDILLLNVIYDFYDKVHSLEDEYDLKTLTVIPSFLVHQSFLCNTAEPLNRAAKLLLGYRKIVTKYTGEVLIKLIPQQKLIESNVKDIYYSIFKHKASSTKLLDVQSSSDLSPYVNIDHALGHHAMFIPHLSIIKESINTSNFDNTEILQVFCPALHQLISLCRENNI